MLSVFELSATRNIVVLGLILFVQSSNLGFNTALGQTDSTLLPISLSDNGSEVTIEAFGQSFCKYDYRSYKKPIFYPIYGPNQIPMTRNFPMTQVAGESNDHPHHKSMWVGHQINGVDFWTENGGKVQLTDLKISQNDSAFIAKHHWIDEKTNEIVVSDITRVHFLAAKEKRGIDYTVTFAANNGAVTFEDTKEGFFAIRVHPMLRGSNDPGHGIENVTGLMTNAQGQSGKGIWGKQAAWVDYSGVVDGQPCGITIFDHPKNLRHPTRWHARDYGLFAANPFGLHHFDNAAEGAGEYTLKNGDDITFQYRVVFHLGKGEKTVLDKELYEFSNRNQQSGQASLD